VARFINPTDDGTSGFEKELVELIIGALRIILSHQTLVEWDVNLEELGKVCQVHERFSGAAKFYELHLKSNEGPETSISRVKVD